MTEPFAAVDVIAWSKMMAWDLSDGYGQALLRARPEPRERIHQAVKELGYTPSHAARSLRLSRAFAVGVIVPDLNNPIYNELVRGIDETAEELGYHVLMSRTEHLEPGTDFLRKLAGEGRVDGFLIQPQRTAGVQKDAPAVDLADVVEGRGLVDPQAARKESPAGVHVVRVDALQDCRQRRQHHDQHHQNSSQPVGALRLHELPPSLSCFHRS